MNERLPNIVWCEATKRPRWHCATAGHHTCSFPACPYRTCPGPHYALHRGERLHGNPPISKRKNDG